jgi:hypothetical protein
MNRLQHFAAGFGIGNAEIFGERGRTPRNTDNSQVQSLYRAEIGWHGSSPFAGRSISEQGARDLAGELIHHPRMDELGNIESVRRRFKPEHLSMDENSKMFSVWMQGKNAYGSTIAGRRILLDPRMANVGTVTHEVSHMLSGHQFTMGTATHEWDFARTHLGAVASLNKDAANDLIRHYRRLGVSFQP